MNDLPPQDPTAQPQALAPQPGQPPGDEAASKLKRAKIIGVVAALLLLVVGYGVGRTVEKSLYDPGKDAYQEIYEAGAKSGAVSGAEAGKQQGLKEGLKEGKAEGAEKGKKAGIKEGTEEGFAEGTQEGANAALGGLTGWSTDTPYAVEFDKGPSSNVPYAISNRVLMEPGVYYKICNSGEGICVAQPDNGGGPTGPTP